MRGTGGGAGGVGASDLKKKLDIFRPRPMLDSARFRAASPAAAPAAAAAAAVKAASGPAAASAAAGRSCTGAESAFFVVGVGASPPPPPRSTRGVVGGVGGMRAATLPGVENESPTVARAGVRAAAAAAAAEDAAVIWPSSVAMRTSLTAAAPRADSSDACADSSDPRSASTAAVARLRARMRSRGDPLPLTQRTNTPRIFSQCVHLQGARRALCRRRLLQLCELACRRPRARLSRRHSRRCCRRGIRRRHTTRAAAAAVLCPRARPARGSERRRPGRARLRGRREHPGEQPQADRTVRRDLRHRRHDRRAAPRVVARAPAPARAPRLLHAAPRRRRIRRRCPLVDLKLRSHRRRIRTRRRSSRRRRRNVVRRRRERVHVALLAGPRRRRRRGRGAREPFLHEHGNVGRVSWLGRLLPPHRRRRAARRRRGRLRRAAAAAAAADHSVMHSPTTAAAAAAAAGRGLLPRVVRGHLTARTRVLPLLRHAPARQRLDARQQRRLLRLQRAHARRQLPVRVAQVAHLARRGAQPRERRTRAHDANVALDAHGRRTREHKAPAVLRTPARGAGAR